MQLHNRKNRAVQTLTGAFAFDKQVKIIMTSWRHSEVQLRQNKTKFSVPSLGICLGIRFLTFLYFLNGLEPSSNLEEFFLDTKEPFSAFMELFPRAQ